MHRNPVRAGLPARATCALAALAALLAAPLTSQEQRAELKPSVVKRWSYVLPSETWTPVDFKIDLPHAEGRGFEAFKDPNALKLELDCDADGRAETRISGSSGFAILKAHLNGHDVPYGLRFRAAGTAYQYASSTVLEARLESTNLVLIDQDNDGDFTEFGTDAIVVGRRKAASLLSPVLNLDDGLFSISIDGDEIVATPYEGDTGTLSVASGFEARARLDCVVVQNQHGHSFELSRERKGLLVPVGDYRIVGGLVSKGSETVGIRTGRMTSLRVDQGQTTELEWGGPLVAEIDFNKSGETVTISPSGVHYYGRAGEEYVDFLPQGASPKFLVYDEVTKRLLGQARFEGC